MTSEVTTNHWLNENVAGGFEAARGRRPMGAGGELAGLAQIKLTWREMV